MNSSILKRTIQAPELLEKRCFSVFTADYPGTYYCCWSGNENFNLLGFPNWSFSRIFLQEFYSTSRQCFISIPPKTSENLWFSYVFRRYRNGKLAQNESRRVMSSTNPANIYMFKISNRNTRKRCEICSKLIMKKTKTSLTSFWCFHC